MATDEVRLLLKVIGAPQPYLAAYDNYKRDITTDYHQHQKRWKELGDDAERLGNYVEHKEWDKIDLPALPKPKPRRRRTSAITSDVQRARRRSKSPAKAKKPPARQRAKSVPRPRRKVLPNPKPQKFDPEMFEQARDKPMQYGDRDREDSGNPRRKRRAFTKPSVASSAGPYLKGTPKNHPKGPKGGRKI